MKHPIKSMRLCFALSIALAAGPAANATVIYSDFNFDGGWALPPLNGEEGSEVTVANSANVLTDLSIDIYSQGGPFPNPTGIPPGYANFQAQIYANDGTQGAPGSLLWQSSIVHVNYQPGLTLLDFTLPQLLVPNTFTWTLAYYSTSPIPPAMPTALAPTIGTTDTGWFRAVNSLWTPIAESYGVQIEAVPEPGIGALLSASGLAFWHIRRRSTRIKMS